ncbi:MAG: hypothetical protein IJH18_04245 [Bacilli bacterium]|nr:hypothetical protein [Bacilli bacterium]
MRRVFNGYNIALLLIVILLSMFSLKAVSVKAAGTITWSGTSKVTIERTIDNLFNPDAVTFTYKITPTASNPAGASGVPTNATVAFDGTEEMVNNQVKKSSSLSFANVEFNKPGDYMYIIAETDTDNTAFATDSTNIYTAIISVRNEIAASGVPTGNFTASMILKDKDNTKVDGISGADPIAAFIASVNGGKFTHLEIENTVEGNMAEDDVYFAYTINLKGYTGTYPITGIDPQVEYEGTMVTQPTEIIGNTEATIYLKHGQTAVIGRVTEGGTTYDVIPVEYESATQIANLKEKRTPILLANDTGKKTTLFDIVEDNKDYETSYSINGAEVVDGNAITNAEVVPKVVKVTFFNSKNRSIVTGIITTIVPYILLIVITVCGTLIAMNMNNKKETAK